MDIPLIGPSYYLPQVPQSSQRTGNMFAHKLQAQGKTQAMLVPRPGLRALGVSSPYDEALRGLFVADEYLYAVFGGGVYRINAAFSYRTQLIVQNNIGTDTVMRGKAGPVAFARNSTQLVILDGITGYTIDLTAADPRVIEISDPDFMGKTPVAIAPGRMSGAPTTVASLDDYTVVAGDGSRRFASSDLVTAGGATSWNGLEFGTTMATPGPIVRIEVYQRALWMMKTDAIEVWMDVGPQGTTGFPWARQGNVVIPAGVTAAESVCQIDKTMMWVGTTANGDIGVYRNQGYQVAQVGNDSVVAAIRRQARPQDAVAWCYSEGGHHFYVLCLPDEPIRWVYDTTEGLWYEWYSNTLVDPAPWAPFCHAWFAGKHVVGCRQHPFLAVLDPQYAYDGVISDGTTTGPGITIHQPLQQEPELLRGIARIECLRRTPPMVAPDGKRQFFADVEVHLTPGVGADVQPAGDGTYERIAPVLRLRYSNDGGHTWVDAGDRSMGDRGQYLQRVRWSRCGSARTRVWEWSYTAPARVSLLGASARMMTGTA